MGVIMSGMLEQRAKTEMFKIFQKFIQVQVMVDVIGIQNCITGHPAEPVVEPAVAEAELRAIPTGLVQVVAEAAPVVLCPQVVEILEMV